MHRILPCNERLYMYIQKVIYNLEIAIFAIDTIIAVIIKLTVCYYVHLLTKNIILGFPCINNGDIVLNFCLAAAKYHINVCKR